MCGNRAPHFVGYLALAPMIFQRENCKPFAYTTQERVAFELKRTKQSFVILTAEDGAYIQAGGGPTLYVLEYKNMAGVHQRAYQVEPVVPFPDGTILSFSGSSISMDRHDWMLSNQVVEAFDAFATAQPWPSFVYWRRLNADMSKAS